MSNPLRQHGLQPTKLLHPWDFPGKSTGVGCHCLLHPPLQKLMKWSGDNLYMNAQHQPHTYKSCRLPRPGVETVDYTAGDLPVRRAPCEQRPPSRATFLGPCRPAPGASSSPASVLRPRPTPTGCAPADLSLDGCFSAAGSRWTSLPTPPSAASTSHCWPWRPSTCLTPVGSRIHPLS